MSSTAEQEVDVDSASEQDEVDTDSAIEEEVNTDSAIEEDVDSAASSAEDEDEFLLELYAAGKLGAGLNAPKKQFANNVQKLKDVAVGLRLELPWIETMDIVNDLAEMAPELAIEMKEQEEFVKSGKSNSLSLNEFKRETLFHRQAQLAAIEGIARLKSQGVPTTRPDDYFAEMMKSDAHMQKVRRTLLEKQAALKTREKVREIREHKKVAKQKQVESTLRKQKEKRDLNEEIKKYRKGMRTDLDFLDKKSGKNERRGGQNERRGGKNESKNNFKGGKNWKGKKNFKKKNFQKDDNDKPKSFHKAGKQSFHKGGKKNNRPGKERRKNIKNKQH